MGVHSFIYMRITQFQYTIEQADFVASNLLNMLLLTDTILYAAY